MPPGPPAYNCDLRLERGQIARLLRACSRLRAMSRRHAVLLAPHGHSILHPGHAGASGRRAVDFEKAFLAHAHSTERSSEIAVSGNAQARLAGPDEGRQKAFAARA